MMAALFNPQKGTWVLLSFIAFFGIIVAVNTVFITTALDTHSGVVTQRPYEKGLAFNALLEKAKAQSDIAHDLSFENGILRLSLPISNADVSATFFRPVKDGYDFNMQMAHQGDGVYTAKPENLLKGAWTVRVKAIWDKQMFQTAQDFIIR